MRVEQIMFPILRAAAKRDWAMRATDRVLRPWNPFSPERYRDPYPLYEKVRAAGPVVYQRSLRIWSIAGYEEAEATLRSTDASVDRRDLISSITPYNKLNGTTVEMFTSSILMIDPPDHTRLRKLVSRAFTPRAVERLEPSIQEITLDLLHDLEGQGRTEAMKAFADRLPIFAISDMLGLPRGEWDRFKAISDEMVKFIDPITGFDPVAMDAAVSDFTTLLADLIEARRDQPQDDMLTRLLEVEEDGDRLSRDELTSMVALLMVAGHETTAGLIGNSLIALDCHPTAKEQLLEEPELAPNAVEELLRFDSPVQATNRILTAPIAIGGQTMKPGQTCFVLLGAANRDPRHHDRPNELILDREDPRPLSFGHGIHHCLGAALARLEARIALPLFLRTFPDYSVDHDRVEWKRSTTVRGPEQLPITL